MKLVVSARLRLYEDGRFVLAMSYGEDNASQVEDLTEEVASNAAYFLRKSHIWGTGDQFQYFDWKKGLFSNSASHQDNYKILSEIRGTGREDFLNKLSEVYYGTKNPDFCQSNVSLFVEGKPTDWITAWDEFKGRLDY